MNCVYKEHILRFPWINLFTPQYGWNIAKVGIKHQSINQPFYTALTVYPCKHIILCQNETNSMNIFFSNVYLGLGTQTGRRPSADREDIDFDKKCLTCSSKSGSRTG